MSRRSVRFRQLAVFFAIIFAICHFAAMMLRAKHARYAERAQRGAMTARAHVAEANRSGAVRCYEQIVIYAMPRCFCRARCHARLYLRDARRPRIRRPISSCR